MKQKFSLPTLGIFSMGLAEGGGSGWRWGGSVHLKSKVLREKFTLRKGGVGWRLSQI